MGRYAGRRILPAAVTAVVLLCDGWSYALVPMTGLMQHQRSMDNRGQQGHRPKVLGRQLPASIARSPPLGREQRHQHRRAVSPLGALDTAVAFSEISDEKRDDGSSTNAITRISEAPPAEPRERRVVDVDSGKVKGGGKSRSSKSVRQFFRRKSSEVLSYLTIMATWLLFRFLLKGLNKVECINKQALLDAVLDRGDGRGLLTVSNHMCVYDDPGLWSALIPFWRTGRKKMRWALCTDDIYNANPILKNILKAGRTLPIKRTKGMEQPLLKDFLQKLEQGEWGHIFAEGAIRQPWRFGAGEPVLADFKAGIGRLLLRSENPPLVLPMYHIGMHQIASETPIHKRGRGKLSKIMPNRGRTVRVYVGSPIDLAPVIQKCRENVGDVRSLPWTKRSTMDEVACHREIAAYVREHVLKLEAVARRDYYGNDPGLSPYGVAPA